MTITNHMLAGAIIGIAIKQPVLALPLVLISHFAMDALPHFGYQGNKGFGEALQHKLSYWVGIGAIGTMLLIIALLGFYHQWLALTTGIITTLPDVLGVYNYRRFERHGKKAGGIIKLVHVKFHRAIQRYERPWGIYVEMLVFACLLFLLLKII